MKRDLAYSQGDSQVSGQDASQANATRETDPTFLKSAEEASARLAAIVESSDAAIIGKTLDGIITSWNKGAEQIYGYSAEEVVGKSISVVMPPGRTHELAEVCERLRHGEHIKLYDTVRVRKDGARIEVAVTVSPIKNAEGRVIGASTIARDVTERRRTEAALRQSEERFRLLAENARDVIYRYRPGPEPTFDYVSSSIIDVLGYTPEDIYSNPALILRSAHPEDRGLLKNAMANPVQAGTSFAVRGTRRDGGAIWIEFKRTLVRDESGNIVAVEGVARDITERRQAEAERDRLLAELRKTNERLTLNALAAKAAAESEQTIREELEVQNEEIQSQRQELQALNEELETRVQERTADLARANQALRDEIEVRKRIEADLQRILDSTIEAMALAVEIRDPYTAGHQRRVARLASAIAREMDLSKEQVRGLYLAAIVHDIGKLAVPAEILSKPARLTEIEFSMIKTHSHVGYDILKTIEFPWPIAHIVNQHHERMNGSGYPAGNPGREILLEARILGVADVVEAMASHRPYRPALGIEKALEELHTQRGALYDPAVVDACVRLFDEDSFKFD